MENKKIRIVAAVVDTTQLTLYKEDGTTIVIQQGDARLRTILEEATQPLIEQGWADVSIGTIAERNEFLEFEKASNGVVKLYRVAKSALGKLLGVINAEEIKEVVGVDTVEPTSIGAVPTKLVNTQNAVADILAHAIPVSSDNYHEEGMAKQSNVTEEGGGTPNHHPDQSHKDTIIAVVDGKVIPGMEFIKTQFSRAAKLGSTQGVENFLKRLGAVIHERKHSVEDLIKFLERGDLPIADDGSILIYKLLNRDDKCYKDIHSGNVKQWVGAYVCMDVRLVDHDRRNECSNGLHVARRGYLSGFSGNVCVLAKLAPEDVIAVPQYDANKMRVCGYHIIRELTEEQFRLVKRNQPISDDPDGQILLAEVMAGQHVGRTHEVRITEQRGGGVKVKVVQETKEDREPIVLAPVEALANPEQEKKDVPVDVLKLSEQLGQLSRADKAKKLYEAYLDNEEGALEALKAFKKASKVSWEKLGVPDPESVPTPVPKAKKEAKTVKSVVNNLLVQEIEVSEGSARERIAKLMQLELNPVVAKSIYNLKKQSKKSWEVLGVDNDQAAIIIRLTS